MKQDSQNSTKASRRVLVKEVLAARYAGGQRPLSWDKRQAGIEKIVTEEGETVTLLSGGGQSTPKPGWELLLMRTADERDFQSQLLSAPEEPAVTWTLYGIKPTGSNDQSLS